MKAINISNGKRRDAEVAVEQQIKRSSIETVLSTSEEKINVKLLKNTINSDFQAILKKYNGNLSELEGALIESDPEVNLEIVGKKLRRIHKLYVDQDSNIVYRLNLYQVIYDTNGKEIQRKDINKLPANINTEIPLRWTGKRSLISEAIRHFVFFRKYQLRHINGVTFDFLYNMAKELEKDKSMVLIGAGKKGLDPILLSRGGQPYRGFLEGRTKGDRYSLILHLSDIELKPLIL